MIDYKIEFTRKAEKDLSSLSKKLQKRIIVKLRFFESQKNPFEFASKLKGIENKLLKLGIEHQVVRVTVKDGSFVYYTGLTAQEVTDILTNLGTVDWVSITPYNPGQFYKLKLEKI